MTKKIFSYAKFNLDALLSLSRALRGRTCTCDTSKAPKFGSLNWVIFVSFDDGVEWVFRSPRSGPHAIVTDTSASKILVSEAATLRYLKAHSSIPVPEIYAFDGSSNNDVGVPFILMSKAPGRALSEFDWHQISRQTPGYPSLRPLLPLADQHKEKVMSQLGAIMAELSVFHFDKIGSIFEDHTGSYSVGECLSPTLLWQYRDTLGGINRGPFFEDSRYFDSLISVFIAHSKELSLTPHAFFAPIPDHSEYSTWASYKTAVKRWNDFVAVGSKIEDSKNRLSYCIAGQFLLEMVPQLSLANGYFTLSHPDLHLGNVFVDEDLNITCIIDWGSTSTGPITELITTPGLGNTVSPPSDTLIAAFRSGFSQRSQLGLDCWEKADMMWYFSRLMRMLSTQDYTLFQALYKLMYKVEGEEVDIPTLFLERASQEVNAQLLLTLSEDDLSDEELMQEENAAFGTKPNKTDSLAVARKLTLMSHINRGFIADKRLWRWIEVALEQN